MAVRRRRDIARAPGYRAAVAEVLRIRFACPVPVGHRVRVRWFYATRGAIGPLSPRPHEPIVDDLETDVRYAPGWTLHPNADPTVRELSQLADDPADTLRLERTLTGKVVACTVVAMFANTTYPVQTRLVIEPDPPHPPYR